MHNGVFCDTSFFIRLLDKNDPLHVNAKNYYKYFLEQNITLFISTIAMAEYCTGGDINDLPLKNLQIRPFNIDDAKRTGEIARIVFENKGKLQVSQRNIIPNDTKLFAQADNENTTGYYISSDTESHKIYNLIKQHTTLRFIFIDVNKPYNEVFGVLPFGE